MRRTIAGEFRGLGEFCGEKGNAMSETFFENPLYVYIALGLVELVLLGIWFDRRLRGVAMTMIVPLVLAGIVALVAHLVVTDREQIEAAAQDIADAIAQKQYERIPPHLDEKFLARLHGSVVNKATVIAACNAQITRYGITKVNFHRMKVQIDGQSAKMHVTTFVFFGKNSRTSLVWDARWVKRKDRWLVLEVSEPKQGFEL